MTWKASGKAFDANTRDWTKLVEYSARNEMEARRWTTFNRDWMRELRVWQEE